jgi:hypothetical protein
MFMHLPFLHEYGPLDETMTLVKTHFTKSVHLNGGKDFNMRPIFRKRNFQVYLYVPGVLSFVGGLQGSTLHENGGDEGREGFLRASVGANTVDCGCAAKFLDQVRKGPAGEEQHQTVV